MFTGTYLESVKDVALRSSYYRVVCSIWFRWQGDDDLDMVNNFHIYNGTTNNDFWTVRFPLESHQMRFYIEPNMPASRVVLEKDGDNSSYNPNIGIPGFYIVRHDTAEFTQVYDTSYGKNSDDEITSEFMTQLEINRSGLGLYAKCFIALFGRVMSFTLMFIVILGHILMPLSAYMATV